LFLDFAPHAPHGPATPPVRYRDSLKDLPLYRPPNYNEADMSDKPAWAQKLPLMSETEQATRDAFRLRQFQSLLAVDDAVRDILDALEATGRLAETLIVFSSDNGLSNGSHRWEPKLVPWEESIRVPLIVRYDPLTKGTATTNQGLALNLDFAPTFAGAAGVESPGVEGTSLLPLLGLNPPPWRDDFFIEHWGGRKVPAYCGVRTTQYKYVRYDSGEEELYDLNADPYELQSKALDDAYEAIKTQLHSRLVELCSPPPPGYTP